MNMSPHIFINICTHTHTCMYLHTCSIFDVYGCTCVFGVAKTHRMSHFCSSFSTKGPYTSRLLCEK